MKISRVLYGRSTDFELTREELQKAYQEYDELVLREQIEKFLLEKKGVISMDAYTGVIDTCVRACRHEMSAGKAKAPALLDAINMHFKYMEYTPPGLVELQPGFSCIDNLLKDPSRVCFCISGVALSKETPGYTGMDLFRLSGENGYLAQALFQYCVEHPGIKPETVCTSAVVKDLARQLESDERYHTRDLQIQRQVQQNRALDFYHAITEQFGREEEALSIALIIYQLTKNTKDLSYEFSMTDAGILAERIHGLFSSSSVPTKDECISSILSLLHFGMDTERCPVLPSVSPQDTKAILLQCTPEAFRAAVYSQTAASQMSQENYRPLEDPGLDALVQETRTFFDREKQTLDAQLCGARMRANPDPTLAPAPQAREQ